MDTKEIRDILGISRAEFARRYGIPKRTLENWDAGIRKPPAWILKLLERVVREDEYFCKNDMDYGVRRAMGIGLDDERSERNLNEA